MRLPRPHVPLSVRVQVAERQCHQQGVILPYISLQYTDRERLDLLLAALFGKDQFHLDHDPPLAARAAFRSDGSFWHYSPHANDPRHLVYRTAEDHRIKTLVHGEHGQYSDRALIKREKRRRNPKRRRYKWPTRTVQNRGRKALHSL